jgi:DNA-binding transcriptional MerR regulator
MRHDLIVRSITSEDVTLANLAKRAEMHPILLEQLVECGLIRPISPVGAVAFFESSTVLRLRSIKRLRGELGINLQGIAAVLDLLERLRGLEREVASLRVRDF